MGAGVSAALPVFLINLDRDADRLAHMEAAAAKAGIAFTRVPAVLGHAMPDWVRPYFTGADGSITQRLRPGEVGCYASHLVVARRIVEAGVAHALVLEDDLDLPQDLVPLIAAALARLPEGWDILRLSNPPKAAFRPLARLPGGRELVLYSRVPNNTGALVWSAAGARKFLAAGLRDYPVDEHLRRPWLLGLETHGIVPAPIRSNIFETSTIDDLGHRGLGRESQFEKLGRRRIGTPADWLAQLRWQLGRWGLAGLLGAQIRAALRSAGLRDLPLRLPGAGGAGGAPGS